MMLQPSLTDRIDTNTCIWVGWSITTVPDKESMLSTAPGEGHLHSAVSTFLNKIRMEWPGRCCKLKLFMVPDKVMIVSTVPDEDMPHSAVVSHRAFLMTLPFASWRILPTWKLTWIPIHMYLLSMVPDCYDCIYGARWELATFRCDTPDHWLWWRYDQHQIELDAETYPAIDKALVGAAKIDNDFDIERRLTSNRQVRQSISFRPIVGGTSVLSKIHENWRNPVEVLRELPKPVRQPGKYRRPSVSSPRNIEGMFYRSRFLDRFLTGVLYWPYQLFCSLTRPSAVPMFLKHSWTTHGSSYFRQK
jgi:hypothetical protein